MCISRGYGYIVYVYVCVSIFLICDLEFSVISWFHTSPFIVLLLKQSATYFLIVDLVTEFQYFHRDFFFCFFMGFSRLLLISEEETRPCWHPDREKKCMLMYKVNKKTATVATKSSVLGYLTSWRSESLDCFGFGGCLTSPHNKMWAVNWVVSVSYVNAFFFPSIPPYSTW